MFEHELESLNGRAGALKAEIMSLSLNREEQTAACELIDQGVSKIEVLIATRRDEVNEREGGPRLDGGAGLVSKSEDGETEEVEEEVEEDEVDSTGKATGNKKKVVKKVARSKSSKK